MCNIPSELKQEDSNHTMTLLLYRLDKLEEEQRKDNNAIMNTLKAIQDGQTEINKTMVLHTSEIAQIKEKLKLMDINKVEQETFDAECNNLKRRLEIYKQLIIGVGIAVAGSVLMEVIRIL